MEIWDIDWCRSGYSIQITTKLAPVLKSRSDTLQLSQPVTQYDNRDS